MTNKAIKIAVVLALVIIVPILLCNVTLIFVGNSIANGYEDLYSTKNMKTNDVKLISENGSYIFKAFENLYVVGSEDLESDQLKCILSNGNETVVLSGAFYSLSKKDSFLAIHNMQFDYDGNNKKNIHSRKINYKGNSFFVQKDEFYLLNSDTMNMEKYPNYEMFLDACQFLNLKFDVWYYNGKDVCDKELCKGVYLRNCGNYRGQYLFVNNIPKFEGIINSYAIVDDNRIAFSLELPVGDYGCEFITSNDKLDLKTFAVQKTYKTDCLQKEYPVIYHSYLLYNIKEDSYTEFDSSIALEETVNISINWNSTIIEDN